jgi:hypothetical protein
MKHKRFTENQIHDILQEAESGISVSELSRKYGVNEERTHSGKYYFGKTPMKTFKASKHIAKEKHISLIGQIKSMNENEYQIRS